MHSRRQSPYQCTRSRSFSFSLSFCLKAWFIDFRYLTSKNRKTEVTFLIYYWAIFNWCLGWSCYSCELKLSGKKPAYFLIRLIYDLKCLDIDSFKLNLGPQFIKQFFVFYIDLSLDVHTHTVKIIVICSTIYFNNSQS